jgi:hypothetical protein
MASIYATVRPEVELMKKTISENKRTLFVGILAVMAIGATACDDMTTDQYHQQEAAAAKARITAIAGTYSGSLISTDGKTQMGGIQIQIEADSQPVNSPDDTSMVSQSITRANVTLIGATSIEVPVTSVDYNPDNGHFEGQISISNPNDTSNPTQVKIDGYISNGTYSGTIQSSQYLFGGGTFSAKLGGALPSQSSLAKGPAAAPDTSTYVGQISNEPSCDTFKNGEVVATGTCQVTLSIFDSPSTPAGSVLDYIVPVSNVIVSRSLNDIALDDSVTPQGWPQGFVTATYDRKNGVLIGSGSTNNNSGAVLQISCNKIQVSGNQYGSSGFLCTETSSQGTVRQYSVFPAASVGSLAAAAAAQPIAKK